MILPSARSLVDPQSLEAPARGTVTTRQTGRVDRLAEARRALAKADPSDELAILIRASGYDGSIGDPVNRLAQLELLGTLIRQGGRL